MPGPVRIEVSATQKRELLRIVNAKTSSQREVFRARILLGLPRGLSHQEIAEEQSVSLLARLSNAPSPDCLWARDTFAPGPMTTTGTER